MMPAAAGSPGPGMPGRVELTSAGYYKVSFTAPVNPDGSFSFSSVPPGSYFVNLPGCRTTPTSSPRASTDGTS